MPKNYALITGASDGIGREMAWIMAENGHSLVLVARRKELLETLKKEILAKYAVQVEVFGADLTLPEAIEQLHAFCRNFTIDILVNNAGVGSYGYFHTLDWQKESAMVDLNVKALMYLSRLFVPAMVERGYGRVLNVASVAAFQPGPRMATYFATKAFVLSFSQAMAWELRNTGVTVTVLCPGPVLTGFQQAAGAAHSNMLRWMPLPSPRAVAMCGYRGMLKGKRVIIQGFLNRLMVFLTTFVPSGLVLAASAKAIEIPSKQ